MKKFLSILSLSIAILLVFSGCTGAENTKKNNKLKIVTTVFPVYDWVRNIVGENSDIELTMLLDSGVDLHSFQPTADDIITVSSADMFIYIGGESDEWTEDALKETVNKDMTVISLMDELGNNAKEEELKEGMEPEEEEEAEDGAPEYDEHIWLSLKNAAVLCEKIKDALVLKDSEHKAVYEENCKKYTDELISLDKEYENAVNSSKIKTLLFADRFPFRYLADDYGLDYFAAFKGCSAESEASFETVSFLAKKTDELNLSCVFTIDGTKTNIAKTVVENTKTQNQKILSLNSMQSVTSGDVENGVKYIDIMKSNLSVLKEALS